MSHTLIFDIGKTNKKCFLFDRDYKELYKSYVRFDEMKDEDDFPCDDLYAIQSWMKETLHKAMGYKDYDISAINFSTYGASFVHIDEFGKPLTPLYNYLKPFPEDLLQQFYDKYGTPGKIARETASPQLGMLNSGMQLYWLKYRKPEIFEKIKWSLHFPQYLSYLLTGIPLSDFTSIGCHTGLWDYDENDYHDWVYEEGIDKKLAPIVGTYTSINTRLENKTVKVGVGVHDSSGALIPYLRSDKKPFLLLSTGTWSIALNPYSTDRLTAQDLELDCLNYLRVNGKPVKASRLFLGNEHKLQTGYLQQHYNVPEGTHKTISFDEAIYIKLTQNKQRYFHLESINLPIKQPGKTNLQHFSTYKEAYHQLMIEMVDLQVEAASRAMGTTSINKLYIDGGFADNDLYVKMLSLHFPEVKIRTTKSPLGSALGASMVISDESIQKKFLKKHYAMKKVSYELVNESNKNS